MAYCGPRGIPYEHWLGGPNVWTVFSRMAALAWQAREADRCGSCGQVHADWHDEQGRELRDPPFEVTARRCLGCESLHDQRQDAGDKAPPYLHPVFTASPPPAGLDPTVSG